MNGNIPYPSETERTESIAYIVENGVRRRAGFSDIWKAADAITVKNLFFGVEDCLFIAVMLSILCGVFTAVAAAEHTPVLPLLFLFSPALYAALCFLTAWKDAMSKTLEWKQTCRMSFRAMTALRMLCFGGAAAFVCVLQCLLLWRAADKLYSFTWMMGAAFSSLFLYASLSLALQSLLRRSTAAVPVVWIGVGIVLLSGEKANVFLLKIPAFVFFLIAAAAAAVMLYQIKRYIERPIEGGVPYAVR